MPSSTPPNNPPPRKLILLGSTGSIGVNTLRVVENLAPAFDVVAIAAGSNTDRAIEQAKTFHVQHIAMADPNAAATLTQNLPNATTYTGPDAAQQLVQATDADITVSAIVGAAGLAATLTAIQKGMDIALANKETLVAAGELVMPLVKKHNVALLPVDSEHSAIFQCLQTGQHDETGGPGVAKSVKRIVLTASGGPFRETPLEQIQNATVEQALNHPTWNMGPKITIDSATMMNKALEIIEAHWLFGLTADQIDVIIHPQSIAHSFVEYDDHSILAQLGAPDMKTPIQYALTYPHRAPGCSDALDWTTLSRLDFHQPDHERFPALGLAYRAIRAGGTAGAILNAANEQAVAAFLEQRIRFGRIVELVEQAMDAIPPKHIDNLDIVFEADAQARTFVTEQIDRS